MSLTYSHCANLLIISMSLGLFACGGGGSGGKTSPTSSATSSLSSSATSSVASSLAPIPGIVTTLTLGAPTTNPIVIPPSATAVPVKFLSVVRGNYYPEHLLLDEVDKDGVVVRPGVAMLKDDGNNGDAFRGDQIYTGQLLLGSVASAEKSYRVHADHKGQDVKSGTGRFWVSGCPSVARPSNPDKAVLDISSNSYVFADEVLVTLADTVAPELSDINTIMAEAKGQVVGCIPALNQYLVELSDSTTAASLFAAIATLKSKTTLVVDASPNALVLNPPAEKVTCDGKECQWYLQRIRAPEAWALVGGGDKQMGVGVIDFGVDCNHSGLNCNGGTNSEDTIDHGTGVASLIAAHKGDSSAMVGVAWNTALYPFSFMARGGSQYKMSELITLSMAEESIRVINISAATAMDPSNQIRDAMCSAIDSGRLIVAAAGNASTANSCQLENTYPARYNTTGKCANGADLAKGLLVVGAIDANNNLAQWENNTLCSNILHVDLFAPGKDIYAASTNNNGYAAKNGTSFAAPLVAGSAAVLWAAQPTLTMSQIHDKLVASSATYSKGTGPSRSQTQDQRLEGKPLLDLFAAVGGKDTQLAPDLVPDAFAFTALNNVDLNVYIQSEAVVIKGIDATVPISIDGGFYAIDNTPFTSAAGTVGPNQKLVVQLLSATVPLTSRELTLTVAGIKQSFKVTTAAAVAAQPSSFNFSDIANAELGSPVLSSPLIIAGLAADTPISIVGAEYAIADGAFTSVPGTVNANQVIQLRVTAASTPDTSLQASITIGGISDSFRVTTLAADTSPEPFAFADINNIAPGSLLTANTISVKGINTEANISVSGGEYALDGGSYRTTAGKVKAGQTVTLRHKSAAQFGADTYSALTIGTYTANFRSHTQSDATTPSNSAPVASNVTITDGNGGTASLGDILSGNYSYADANSDLEGSSSYVWLRNGTDIISTSRNYTVTQVDSGKTLQFKVTPRAVTGTVIGSEASSAVFTVASFAPAAFTFTSVAGAAPSSANTSNTITISGLSAATSISITGGDYAINDGAFTSAAGTISNGQTVKIRVTAPTALHTNAQAILTVGGVSASFSVTSAAPDTTPDAFSFTPVTNAALNTVVISNTVTISGINTATPISINTGYYSINGGVFTSTAGTLSAGHTVRVRLTTSTNANTATEALLTIGSVSAPFRAVTIANQPPTIVSPSAITVNENTSQTSYIPSATDPEGDTLSFTLSGRDAALFRLASDTGELQFVSLPDFEHPKDDDGNNIYQIDLIVTDAKGDKGQLALTITVKNEVRHVKVDLLFPTPGSDVGRGYATTTTVTCRFVDLEAGAIKAISATANGISLAETSPGSGIWFAKIAAQPGENALTIAANLQSETALLNTAFIFNNKGALKSPRGLAVDPAKNSVYIIDGAHDSLLKADLTTGHRQVISDAQTWLDVSAFSPGPVRLSNGNASLLVAEQSGGKLFEFNLTTGSRTQKDSNLNNGVGGGIALDSTGKRALVAGGYRGEIYGVELNSGAVTVVASATVGAGDALGWPYDIEPNASFEQYIVAAQKPNTLLSFNPVSGDRFIVASDTLGSGAAMGAPNAVVFNPSGNRIWVGDSAGVLEVDLASQTRQRLLSTNTSIVDLALDADNNRLLLADPSNFSVQAMNATTFSKTLFLDGSLGKGQHFKSPGAVAYESSGHNVYVGDGSIIFRVELATGNREIFSGQGVGSGPELFSIDDMQVDSAANQMYVLDSNSLYRVSLTTGNRTLVSSSSVGSGPAFSNARNLAIAPENNLAWYVDTSLDQVIQVNLITGDRLILSGGGKGTGLTFSFPYSIVFDKAHNRLLVFDGGNIVAVTMSNGDRTQLSSAANSGLPMVHVREMSLDPLRNRLLVVTNAYIPDLAEILAVDLSTGQRTPVSLNGTLGSGPAFIDTSGIAVDGENNRAFIVDSGEGTGALLLMSLTTGDRVMLAQ